MSTADRPTPTYGSANVPRTGRGAVSNPVGRFESTQKEAQDDGWGILDEPLPPVHTTVGIDTSRSIIARNNSPDIPFTQSINPYRGCEHGCVYCISGDTPILMADGTTRPMSRIRTGDWIYGTVRRGWYRRYEKTQVLGHWSVIKPAYRIELQDGTELVAGGDHRFLTERGWKFVIGAQCGAARRPHLTMGNKLMGTGAFGTAVAKDAEYRTGYLCGLIRGDGLLGSYDYSHRRRRQDIQHHFRLALCDSEALQRAQEYLSHWKIETKEFAFVGATATRKAMQAIRTHARRDVELIGELIAWPTDPSIGWQAGFLSGIFDAEGSYGDGILRIPNTDPEIIDHIGRSLRAFNFNFVIEHIQREITKSIDVVRLLGGLREHLRFFHRTDPAIIRKRDIAGQAVKSTAMLGVTSVESLGKSIRLYDMSTGTEDFIANGVVSHNCYARPSHAYLNLSPGLDFETKLFYKPDAIKQLKAELAAKNYECSPIALGANTDPYQPIEREYGVTRAILQTLSDCNHPATIVTKGAAMIERDIELLAGMAQRNLVAVYISITTLDKNLKRTLEPRAASPAARLAIVRKLADAHVPVGIMMAPVIPVLTDHELENIVDAAAAAGASTAGYVMLRLPYEVNPLFQEWLQTHEPLKTEHVMSRMRELRGGKDYDSRFGSRMRGAGVFADLFRKRFELACRKHGLNKDGRKVLDTSKFVPPVMEGRQMGLF
jgi:DNA repair photolyase